MSGLLAEVAIPTTPLSGTTTKTIVQLKAPANQRLKIVGYGFYTDGTTQTNGPVKLAFLRQSSAGTSLQSVTPIADEPELTETVQATAQVGSATTQNEPTTTGTLRYVSVPSLMGTYEVALPFGQEIYVGGGTYFGVAATAPAAVNISGFLRYEE